MHVHDIDPDVMAAWRAYRDTLNVVLVDGELDYFDPDDPVMIETDGMTYTFDWFEGCCVWTLDGGIEITKDLPMIEEAMANRTAQ